MKISRLFLCLCLAAGPLFAQSSQDSWDSRFNPGVLQRRQNQRYLEWLNSWRHRECTIEDVKQYWLMTLTQVLPDSMSAQYHPIMRQNEALQGALIGTEYDFQAQDVADQINIARLRNDGLKKEAADLDKQRLRRIEIRRQQEAQEQIIAHQKAIEQEINELRADVEAAIIAASRAQQAAQQAADKAAQQAAIQAGQR